MGFKKGVRTMPAIINKPAPAQPEQKVTREPVRLMDLETSYLSLAIGEFQELTIAKIEKIAGSDPKFNLHGVDYKYEITTTDGKLLSINAWSLWNALRSVLREAKKIEGIEVKIEHSGEGEYSVKIV